MNENRTERLYLGCRAALLFHSTQIWNEEQVHLWQAITGKTDCTSKTLCDFLREVTGQESDSKPAEGLYIGLRRDASNNQGS